MTFTYRWSDGTAGQTDTLPASDVGQNVRVTVTATNDANTPVSATSQAVGPVTAAPPPPPPPPPSTTYYVGQAAAGIGNGSSCANEEPASWFNNSANWGTGAGQVGPGTTVALCGVITSPLTVLGSGTAGNPITVYWEPGASLSEPYCPNSNTGCINISGRSYVTLDGGTNGSIQATANGTGLANTVGNSVGVSAFGCNHCTVQNLAIHSIYVHVPAASGADCAAGTDDGMIGSGSDWTIANNTFYDERTGVEWQAGPTDSNLQMYGNTIYHNDTASQWDPQAKGTNIGPIYFHNNHYYDPYTWDTGTQDCYHHEAVHIFTGNNAGPSHWAGVYVYNNQFTGKTDDPAFDPGIENMTSEFYIEGQGGTQALDNSSVSYFFNNVFTSNYYINNGLLWAASGELHVMNNTMVSGNTSQGVGYQTGSGGANRNVNVNEQFQNNVLSTAGQLIYVPGFSGLWASGSPDYNVYANGGQNAFVCGGSYLSFTAFSTWQSCVGGAGDAHSQTAPSALLNADGLPQAGSPTAGAGTNLTSECIGPLVPLCSNINGVARPTTGPWNIGAY
jgi:hypothetical protein